MSRIRCAKGTEVVSEIRNFGLNRSCRSRIFEKGNMSTKLFCRDEVADRFFISSCGFAGFSDPHCHKEEKPQRWLQQRTVTGPLHPPLRRGWCGVEIATPSRWLASGTLLGAFLALELRLEQGESGVEIFTYTCTQKLGVQNKCIVDVLVRTYAHIHAYTCTASNTQTHTHIRTNTYIHLHKHTHTHAYMYTYTHTQIQTHTYTYREGEKRIPLLDTERGRRITSMQH